MAYQVHQIPYKLYPIKLLIIPIKTIDLQGHSDNKVSQILYYEVTIRKLRYLGLKDSQVIELHPYQGIYVSARA